MKNGNTKIHGKAGDRSTRMGDYWSVHENDPSWLGGAPCLESDCGERLVAIVFDEHERKVVAAVVEADTGPDGADQIVHHEVKIPRWELPLLIGATWGACAMAGVHIPPPPAAVELLCGWLGWRS